MRNDCRLHCGLSVLALALALVPCAARSAGAPAIAAFDDAFSKVNDYTMTIKAHEVLGSRTQTRTYNYWWKRPNKAKTLIVDGDGRGSGGVWAGGDTVSGHQAVCCRSFTSRSAFTTRARPLCAVTRFPTA